jgi:hypothetical protein
MNALETLPQSTGVGREESSIFMKQGEEGFGEAMHLLCHLTLILLDTQKLGLLNDGERPEDHRSG